MTKREFSVFVILALTVLPAASVRAQGPEDWDARANYVSRDTLLALETRWRLASESPGYSEVLREQARLEAVAINDRLVRGDFQVGGRVALNVEAEEALSDTFAVNTDLSITLPEIGGVSLVGVLRSELQDVVATHLALYIRDPVVRARSLVPITVLGGDTPGFYTFPSETRLTDVLNQAGSPGTLREFNRIRIVRAGETVLGGIRLQERITAGQTLDELSILAGDQIVLPLSQPRDTQALVRTFALLLTIPLAVVALLNLF